MRTAIIAALIAALASTAVAKPHRKAPHAKPTAWMRDCIHERTGPDGGVSFAEARRICALEQPEDDLSAAKSALTLAKLNAKVAKAQERVRKALEACEQAVTDRCVEDAPSDGSRDCDTDAGLRAEYELACLGKPGA